MRTFLSACFLTASLAANFAFAQSWNPLSPTGTTPAARGLNGAPGVFDPASDRMIVFGGRNHSGKNLNDVWVLVNADGSGATPQWVNLIPNGAAGSPPARSGHSTVYDSSNNLRRLRWLLRTGTQRRLGIEQRKRIGRHARLDRAFGRNPALGTHQQSRRV